VANLESFQVQKRKIASVGLTLLLRMSKEKFSLWTNPFFKPITSIPQGRKAVEATDTFRIFNEQVRGTTTAPDTKMEPEPDEQPITVFTDGMERINPRQAQEFLRGGRQQKQSN
jgi:hypothetical protein